MLAPVSKLTTAAKRMLLGRPFRSDSLGHTLLPKRIALPIFASDAMSSVAYAPEEIFLVLSAAGISAFVYAPWVGIAVAIVMAVVVASYRQNVHAYPSGGGDYEVATTNIGPNAGLTVGSALLVDYVLTVAVSISSAASNIGSAIPFVATHKVLFAVVAIALLTAINLRGVRESGKTFAIPTYAFIFGMFLMLGWGLLRIYVFGEDLTAESAGFGLEAEEEHLYGIAFAFLIARAFSSGCAALTGVEAISNGVPAFRKPKSRNAATTLLLLGVIAITLLMGIIMLAQKIGIVYAHNPDHLIGAPADYHQKTLIAQLAETVFAGFPIGFFFLTVVTALILVLAANTAFNGFPVLGSVLAQDRYLPRQLHTRGDRLAFSNGILFLSGAAIAFVVLFDAEVTKLIQLYIVGVFVSFVLSQFGMLRHWTRHLRTETDPAQRARMKRSRVINAVGLTMTGTVLVIVLITKFFSRRLHRHFRDGRDLRGDEDDSAPLRFGGPRTRRARVGRRTAEPVAFDRAGLAAAPADPPGPRLRARHPSGHARGHHRQRRRPRHQSSGARMGAKRYQRAAEGDRIAVPRDHQTGARLRQAGAQGRTTRCRHRLHPGVRGRSLVGAVAAQPERAAAQGQVAVRTRCDGDQRALAAELLGQSPCGRGDRRPRRGAAWVRGPVVTGRGERGR